MTHTTPTPLQDALAWWATLDNMGGFKAAGEQLFPGWTPRQSCCYPPHRDDRLPTFCLRGSASEMWHFKDLKTHEVGGLTAFVMLAGYDTDRAQRWLMDEWERHGGAAALPSPVSSTTNATNGNGNSNGNGSHPPTNGTANGHPVIKDASDATHEIWVPPAIATAIKVPQAPPPPENPWHGALDTAIVTSGELQEMELVPRPKLLGDWFCEGDLGFIFAFRGVGKTWLAMLMARAISEGGRLGEWRAPAPARVLYVDGEMPPDLMRSRDYGLARSAQGRLEFLNHEILFRRTHRVMNITHPDVQRAILERCEQTGVKLLILDNLSTLASGMKENDADDWEMVGRWLLDFRRRQIAVVVVHHAGRNGEMRGTTKREDDAFWIVALEDARQAADDRRGARFISRFTKQTRNTPDEIPPYEWHIQPADADGAISVGHKMATGSDMLKRLVGMGITDCTDLAEELHVSKGTVSKWAHKGICEGWLTKEGRSYAIKE